MAHLFEITTKDGENIRELARVGQAQDNKLDKLLTTMDRLAYIVIRHEERLASLEGGGTAQ